METKCKFSTGHFKKTIEARQLLFYKTLPRWTTVICNIVVYPSKKERVMLQKCFLKHKQYYCMSICLTLSVLWFFKSLRFNIKIRGLLYKGPKRILTIGVTWEKKNKSYHWLIGSAPTVKIRLDSKVKSDHQRETRRQ